MDRWHPMPYHREAGCREVGDGRGRLDSSGAGRGPVRPGRASDLVGRWRRIDSGGCDDGPTGLVVGDLGGACDVRRDGFLGRGARPARTSSSSWSMTCGGTRSAARGHPFVEDAEHRPARPRGGALPQRLRHHAALLAVAGPASSPASTPTRHGVSDNGDDDAAEPPARHLPRAPARRRLRDGLRRQVAHGQRRLAPPRLRPLGQLQGPGQYVDPDAQRRRRGRRRPRAT